MAQLGLAPGYVFSMNTSGRKSDLAQLMAPESALVLVDD